MYAVFVSNFELIKKTPLPINFLLFQRSIFSYTTSRAPQTLEIETVQTIQTDESQSDPDSDVEMDALDDEELPSTATPCGDMVVPNS